MTNASRAENESVVPNGQADKPAADSAAAVDADSETRRALVGKGSVYTAATALQLLGVILVLPAISRLLPREEYGQLALAVILTNLLGLVATLGLPAVITREYFRPDGPAKARLLAAGTMSVSMIVVVFVLLTGPLWAAPLGGFSAALAIGTATGASWAVIVTAQAVLRAVGAAKRFVALAVINVLGGQLAGLGAALTLQATARMYLAGVAMGSVVAALVGLVWVRPSFAGWREKASVSKWLRIALPTIPHTAALFLMATGDRFIVDMQRGDAAVAGYAIAYQIGALGITVVAAANNAWAPLIYGAPPDRRWELLSVTTKDMTGLAALLGGMLALTAPLALWVLADPNKYDVESLIPVVAITALATVPYALYLASAHVLFWTGKTTQLLWITPLAVAINLIAKAVVLPHWGFTGAAVVTVGAYMLLAVLVGGVRRRLAQVQWSGRGVALIGAVAACGVGAYLPSNIWTDVLRVILTLCALGLAATLLRALWAAKAN